MAMQKKFRIIITGSNGFLGQHLANFLLDRGFEVFATSRGINQNKFAKGLHYSSVDLTDKAALNAAIERIKPDVIVHNAAMSKPDACHNFREECLLNNVYATQFLLEASRPFNPYFLYVSTDFIFGEDGPHDEETAPDPLNFYGESKLKAEQLVKGSGLSYGIMRPVFIYGPRHEGMRPTFLHWVKNSLEQKKEIKVVNDQRSTPTFVFDICKGIEAMIEKRFEGAIHLAGKDILSPYQMALTVAKELNLDSSLITPVTSDTFPEPVARAKNSGLKIDKARQLLGYEPVSFEEGVRNSLVSYNV